MKKLLFFIEDENEPKRKTRVYNVYSSHSNDFLGKIH